MNNLDRRTYLAGCILSSEWFCPTNENDSKNLVKSVDCIIAELDRSDCPHAFQGLRCLKCGASK